MCWFENFNGGITTSDVGKQRNGRLSFDPITTKKFDGVQLGSKQLDDEIAFGITLEKV
jgi:hypothetical protein